MIDESLEVVLFYPEDALEVFDKDIDSNIIEENEKNAYLAYGQYDDSTSYYYYYGKDGSFFELQDNYEEIKIVLDENISVELP